MRTTDTRRSTIAVGRACIVAVLVAVAQPTPAAAFDWTFQSTGTGTIQFNDNIRNSPTGGTSAVGMTLTPTAALIGRTEVTELEFATTTSIIRYYGVDDKDSTPYPTLRFNGQRQFETSSLGVGASLDIQPTSVTEQEDSGLINTDGTRVSQSVDANWSKQISERNTISLSGGYSNTTFDIAQFTDSAAYNWSASWSRQSGELQSFVLSATGNYFRPSGGGSASDTYGIRLGRDWRLAENWTFSTLSGARYQISQATTPTGSSNNGTLGTLLSATLTYSGELTTFSGTFNRSLQESSRGDTNEVDAVDLSVNRRLTEHLSLSFGLNGSQSTASSGQGGSVRQALSANSGLNWTINEMWTLSSSVSHSRQTLGDAGASSSNVAKLTLSVALP